MGAGTVIYWGGLFVHTKSCHTNLKYKMDLKVDVFEKIAGTFTAAVYLQNLYIKYLRIWISCWRREREREREEKGNAG